MCCIFTCCGWLIDLLQRCWTFTMSCVISSAVCCSLLTASMSGVALGYNYSLAEYIDLKETNVSVYLKRGVFDDEIADDMEWRRSGRKVDGLIGENNLMTGDADESTTLRSGRRLDDSIYKSNDRNNFEGSLMKLTAKAPDPSPQPYSGNMDIPMRKIIKPFAPGSLDQLKAIQSAINMRKSAEENLRSKSKDMGVADNSRRFDNSNPDGRRAMAIDMPAFKHRATTYTSHRLAVPDDQIKDRVLWWKSNLEPNMDKNRPVVDDIFHHMGSTHRPPMTPRAGPVRPTRPVPRKGPFMTQSSLTPTRSPEPNLPKSIDEDMESLKDKPLLERFDEHRVKEDDYINKMKDPNKKEEDYEDEIKGIPLRRKRNIDLPTFNNNKTTVGNFNTSDIEVHSSNNNIIFKLDKLNVSNDNGQKETQYTTSIHVRKVSDSSMSKTTTNMETKTLIIKLLLAASVA